MPDPLDRPRGFLAELKRRKVYRVAIAYVAVVFVGLEAVDLLIPSTTLPAWADELLLAIAIMGFPVAVVAAWAFELTPEGVRRTPSTAREPGQATEALPDGRTASPAKVLSALGLLVATAAAGWYVLGGRGGADPGVTDRSIAVLPFDYLGPGEATAFTDGVHGDLLTRLSHISDLTVTSRTSVMRYRSTEASLPAIATELGVAWVLHGEVQEAGDQVQVNARLVRAETDQQMWAESYRRQLTAANLFEIQAEITRQIAGALESQLSPLEERQVDRAPTASLDAYRRYAEGREGLDQRTEDGVLSSLEAFQRAIEEDSSYALAWVGLSDGLSLVRFYNYPNPGVPVTAKQAARRALELDPDLGEAHVSLGIAHSVVGEGAEALRELQRGVELAPGYAEAHSWLGWMYVIAGKPERALEPQERSAALNPLGPAARIYLALAYLANGRNRDALTEAQRARELQPDLPLARFMEALVLYHLGRMAEAKAVLGEVLPHVRSGGTPSPSEVRAVLALAHAASGDSAAASEELDEIDDAFSAGLVHAALGEEDVAFEAFASIAEWGTFETEHARYLFPDVLGPLRDDPRYQALLNRVDAAWGLGRTASDE